MGKPLQVTRFNIKKNSMIYDRGKFLKITRVLH
jgi:hypothetical protein